MKDQKQNGGSFQVGYVCHGIFRVVLISHCKNYTPQNTGRRLANADSIHLQLPLQSDPFFPDSGVCGLTAPFTGRIGGRRQAPWRQDEERRSVQHATKAAWTNGSQRGAAKEARMTQVASTFSTRSYHAAKSVGRGAMCCAMS